ncbi:hypothetical protein PC116_g2722 [Phytophthora cactorum]|nr:hypothetical protein PC116_g2722 [Phytophthora cactorum]
MIFCSCGRVDSQASTGTASETSFYVHRDSGTSDCQSSTL